MGIEYKAQANQQITPVMAASLFDAVSSQSEWFVLRRDDNQELSLRFAQTKKDADWPEDFRMEVDMNANSIYVVFYTGSEQAKQKFLNFVRNVLALKTAASEFEQL